MHHLLRPLCVFPALLLGCAASAAQAQSRNSGHVELAVAIVDGCTVTTTPVYFGLIIGTSGTARTTGNVSVQCTANRDFTVSIDYGQNANGINRRMRNQTTGDVLRYRLFSDPGYSQLWTNKKRETVTRNSGRTGLVNLPVYAEIPSFSATTRGGVYSDMVTVTVDF